MGVIAQELGTLYTLLDTRVSELYAQAHHSSALQIEGPNNVQILARTTAGTAVTFQLDLLQDFQKYEYRVVGENGVVEVSLLPQASARRYLNATGQFELIHPPAGYTFENAYIDEFSAFLNALDSRQEWYHSLSDVVQILRCLEAVKQSSRNGQRIAISGAGAEE